MLLIICFENKGFSNVNSIKNEPISLAAQYREQFTTGLRIDKNSFYVSEEYYLPQYYSNFGLSIGAGAGYILDPFYSGYQLGLEFKGDYNNLPYGVIFTTGLKYTFMNLSSKSMNNVVSYEKKTNGFIKSNSELLVNNKKNNLAIEFLLGKLFVLNKYNFRTDIGVNFTFFQKNYTKIKSKNKSVNSLNLNEIMQKEGQSIKRFSQQTLFFKLSYKL